MKIYKNISRGYGLAVAIVLAHDPEEAQWLLRHEEHPYENRPLFKVEEWKEVEGIIPASFGAESKVISFNQYWE